MAQKDDIIAGLDDLKAAFDKAGDQAGRRSLRDRLTGADNTELWIGYYNAGGDVVAARNFAGRGDNARALEKLGALETGFIAAAKSYRAGEKSLPEKTVSHKTVSHKTVSHKTVFAGLAEKFSRLTAKLKDPAAAQQKAEAKAKAESLAEAARLESLAAKIGVVKKLVAGQ